MDTAERMAPPMPVVGPAWYARVDDENSAMDIGLDVHGDRTLDFDFEIAGTSQTSRTFSQQHDPFREGHY